MFRRPSAALLLTDARIASSARLALNRRPGAISPSTLRIPALANIEQALTALGGQLSDVVRTRIYVLDIERDWRAVGRAHGARFGEILPATTMVQVSRLIESWMLVEIEADAILGATEVSHRSIGDPRSIGQ